MPEEVQAIREKLVDGFQDLADKDTAFRFENAEQIGQLVAETEPSWSTAAAVAGGILSDKTDGIWATIAKKVRGYDVATAGGELDPLADHKFITALLNGLLARFQTANDTKSATRLQTQIDRLGARDERMDKNRSRINENDLDKKELRANKDNKRKMVKLSLGGLALSSPLANNTIGRRIGLKIVKSGVQSGEKGERKFRAKVDELVAAKLGSTALSSEIA